MSCAIYALINDKLGLVYVGSTTNWKERRRMWSSQLKRVVSGLAVRGIAVSMAERMRGTSFNDWSFQLVEEFAEAVDRDELWKRETFHIAKARVRFGVGCLNKMEPPTLGLSVRRGGFDATS